MGRWLLKMVKRAVVLLLIVFVTVLAVRTYDVQSGPPLALWHTFVPHELPREQIAKADWAAWMAAEDKVFAEVKKEVSDKLTPEEQNPSNRYFEGAAIYPGHFKQDWNRSYELAPSGTPKGAVVLLHGLTDSPYSLRYVAALYQSRGYFVVAPRMPGHGTVPAGLTDVQWQDWAETVRLAVREARLHAPAPAPLHLVGFSNGGALATNYALDALEDPQLARPDEIVLLAPMIGITEMSRFAGVFGWPAVFPAFAKAAWLGIVPEFNPFKYNSFPINGARQSSLLTRDLQAHVARLESSGALAKLAPVLTFQSLIDFTVSTRAIVTSLYARLPSNGSELVLFDLNRNVKFGPLLRNGANLQPDRIFPPAPRNFRTALITNADPNTREVVERVVEAGQTLSETRPLGLEFPFEVFSLSHLALPFPMTDPLYGLTPASNEFGVNLGAIAPRGERGGLIVSLDSLGRLTSNPFYAYVAERIEQNIPR